MTQISTLRLYLLRGMYLLIVVGLGTQVWPDLLQNSQSWALMDGVVVCMLVAFSLLAALGLRYPLQMLPILLWELLWKAIWLSVVAMPKWRAGQMDEAHLANTIACLLVVLVPLVMPWRYVYEQYVRRPGDRWGRQPGGAAGVGAPSDRSTPAQPIRSS
jgi:hypothetical protein